MEELPRKEVGELASSQGQTRNVEGASMGVASVLWGALVASMEEACKQVTAVARDRVAWAPTGS